jgi:hypothetical protein
MRLQHIGLRVLPWHSTPILMDRFRDAPEPKVISRSLPAASGLPKICVADQRCGTIYARLIHFIAGCVWMWKQFGWNNNEGLLILDTRTSFAAALGSMGWKHVEMYFRMIFSYIRRSVQ